MGQMTAIDDQATPSISCDKAPPDYLQTIAWNRMECGLDWHAGYPRHRSPHVQNVDDETP